MRNIFILVCFLLLFRFANAQNYIYQIPKQLDDWKTESIYQTNIITDSLFSLISRIQDNTYDKNTLLELSV